MHVGVGFVFRAAVRARWSWKPSPVHRTDAALRRFTSHLRTRSSFFGLSQHVAHSRTARSIRRPCAFEHAAACRRMRARASSLNSTLNFSPPKGGTNPNDCPPRVESTVRIFVGDSLRGPWLAIATARRRTCSSSRTCRARCVWKSGDEMHATKVRTCPPSVAAASRRRARCRCAKVPGDGSVGRASGVLTKTIERAAQRLLEDWESF